MRKGEMRFANYRHTFTVESLGRALKHHESEGRITFLEAPNDEHPTTFRIRLAASFDFDILEFTMKEAYCLNAGLVTMERLEHVCEVGRQSPNPWSDCGGAVKAHPLCDVHADAAGMP